MPNFIAGTGPLEPELMARLGKHRKILPNGCWDWTAKKDFGYARVKIKGKSYRVIRLICAIYHGLNLNDKTQLALHKLPCSFEGCWNPEHLYVGSHKDNQEDRSRTITHCKNGHDLKYSYKYYNKKTKSFMRRCNYCRRKDA